jgi:hypothetical protein
MARGTGKVREEQENEVQTSGFLLFINQSNQQITIIYVAPDLSLNTTFFCKPDPKSPNRVAAPANRLI